MENSESMKEIKRKSRLLSPSFRKREIKESKNVDENFKLLIEEDYKIENPTSENKNEKENKLIKNDINNDNSENIKIEVIPNSHIKSIYSLSQAGKSEDGLTKINQDSFLVIQNEYNLPDFNVFSVLDGHGENGHLVSRFITKYLATFLRKNKKMKDLKSEEEVYNRLRKNEYNILKKVFKHGEKDISKSTIDASNSGTTCVLVFQIGNRLLCSNIGDSRAILVKGDKGKKIIQLTIDQKPNDPEEQKRIESKGGEVAQFTENGEKYGPFRVWAKGQNYPGIAMSRSIGDYFATSLGVIPEPICSEETIDEDSKYIVIASDGIWEFLSNKKVAKIVLPYYQKKDAEGACKALVKAATAWWNKEDIVVDDITVIIIFF